MELVAPVSAVAQYSLVAEPAAAEAAPMAFRAAAAAAPPVSAAVSMSVSFSGFGPLNGNQTSVGSYIDQVQLAGSSPEMAPLITDIFALSNASDLAAAYNSMSPEVYTSALRNLQLSSDRFLQSMLGCTNLDGVYKFNADGEDTNPDTQDSGTGRSSFQSVDDGTAQSAIANPSAEARKGHFIWANTTANFYDSNSTAQYMGFRTNTVDFSAGAQFALSEDLYCGIAMGYTNYYTDYSDSIAAQSNGYSGQGGVSLTKTFGSTKLALGFAGGMSDIDVSRSNIISAPGSASGDFTSSFYATRLRLSHQIDFEKWYFRPFIDGAFSTIHNDSMNETGAGAMNLMLESGNYNVFTVTPTLQVGTDFKSGNLSIRPMASVGYTRYSNPAPSVDATLQGAPSGVAPFQVNGLNDLNYINTSAGIDFNLSNSVLFQLIYAGQYSENTESNSVQFKVVIPF